jgi:hypothetical protein
MLTPPMISAQQSNFFSSEQKFICTGGSGEKHQTTRIFHLQWRMKLLSVLFPSKTSHMQFFF